ncbi:hypothetical protein IT072_17110 [Leifsonia sp. ZF2019]|uniref:DUF6286 domain-containing protein n=1 Tax=Leifsonia sp. ZF2019 TaxID=2781978 RepID=UPI001CBDC5E8|nr:DUF6286 domain-containing protein [Leifsonia sp. ZF2019]UAJ78915.1 hypothetical protein IT072_17110 [Leifsonia sp. ZF2019]
MSGVDARIVRRETHSPRSTAAVVTAIAIAVVVCWLALESVLHLLQLPPVLMSPRDILTRVAAAPSAGSATLVVVAIAAGLLGLVLLALSILPGRRPRRRLAAERLAIVADDTMLASALARRAAQVAGVAPDAVTVSLGRRSGTVRIVPVSGAPVDRDAVRNAVTEEFAAAGTGAPMRIAVVVPPSGKVGS